MGFIGSWDSGVRDRGADTFPGSLPGKGTEGTEEGLRDNIGFTFWRSVASEGPEGVYRLDI